MDLSRRPRFHDFESRIGVRFQVTTAHGEDAGSWALDRCERLPPPALDDLADADCFTLAWSGSGDRGQSLYHFAAADGFTATLFAVPLSPDRMWVSIS